MVIKNAMKSFSFLNNDTRETLKINAYYVGWIEIGHSIGWPISELFSIFEIIILTIL